MQETKGDAVAPGVEGLLSLQPDDFIFYVGGYPSSFTVSLARPAVSLQKYFLAWRLSILLVFPGWLGCPDCPLCPQPPAPLRFPGYVGCIELDTLNEEVVSLYNFERTFRVDTAVDRPCARYVQPGPMCSPTLHPSPSTLT